MVRNNYLTLLLVAALVSNTNDAWAFDALPEASNVGSRQWAVVFDFDTDSCYPSPAVSTDGDPNPGLSVTGIDTSFVAGCRNSAQLTNSNTYYRAASIRKNGVLYVVRMYALYFMKDKGVPLNQIDGISGHRHDWEFALVWTTIGQLTHASRSAHGDVKTLPIDELHFDAGAPNRVKIVYHKDDAITHAMRFAHEDEQAENALGLWLTPTIVDWRSMKGSDITNKGLRTLLNTHEFGGANCSVNDNNFPNEIAKSPPKDYPSGDEWKVAALRVPIDVVKQWAGRKGG